ncbi:MAG: IS110 family transposase [Planctomycetota bacterium]|nr:MAG: IS110 family transposase [Planctomycetota bacterium]
MRFVGIDVASEVHVVAAVDTACDVLIKPTKIGEDAGGYARLLKLLGSPEETLVAMEATGHYWRNVFAALAGAGFKIALLNPLRTRRFAEEDLQRTKTDAIDALGIARFAAQKRPPATPVPEQATEELRELVRHRDRLVQDLGDRVRQLHRLVDLGFPEFTRTVKDLSSQLAVAILREFPTAEAFRNASFKAVAKLVYDGRHKVGLARARKLVEAARESVGAHHGPAYRVQIRHTCDAITMLREQIRELDGNVAQRLEEHEVGKLLTTIDGIGPHTAARLVAELGDPSAFRSPAALASYVGVVPGLKLSGKKKGVRAPLASYGNARLRRALYMPTLTAIRLSPWLRAFYERLRARGKPGKVALVACMRKLLHAVYSVAKNRRPFELRLETNATP